MITLTKEEFLTLFNHAITGVLLKRSYLGKDSPLLLGVEREFEELITLREKHCPRVVTMSLKEGEKKCQAEDQGGYQCCPNPAYWQTKGAHLYQYGIAYYCKDHRINKHIWTEAEATRELEPIPQEGEKK